MLIHPTTQEQDAPIIQAVMPEAIEQMAVDRYKVVPSHESMFHRWAVVAGNGTQQLYLGQESECQNMARKFISAFLDGAFVAMQNAAPAHQSLEAAPVELPEPAAWMISGSLMTWKGEFAEHDAKAEARRCGGDCTAFALFTEQQVRNLMAAHGIRGSATHTHAQHEK